MDFRKIEKKWQQKWKKAKLFEANPQKGKKKFFSSIVIPYVNGNAHIGHCFTYTRTDIYARYKRMQGYNTLLACGFHATGEPILGTVERLKKGDKSQADTFKLFGATDKDINNFKNRGPEYVADFWAKKMEESFNLIGYSFDWRRKFILSITPQFSKFVQWQYNTLKSKGFVAQGTHPVIWCPHDKSPTGDHDRLEGEGESPIDYALIKFELKSEKTFLPAATLRPETVYGVTNMWVNPDADYVLAQVGKEKWIVSESAAAKLSDQQKVVKVLKKISAQDLLGKKLIDPVGNREIPILPARFVNVDTSTGIVMSVPAHAPYDWIVLKEFLDNSKEMERYGIEKQDLEPISLIKIEGFGDFPAIEIVNRMGIKSSKQTDLLDKATSEIYKKEFHKGILKDVTGEYAGKKVSEVKDEIINELEEAGVADKLWETTGTVVCRCTTKCHVKILENQWFLRYSDPMWKGFARKCLEQMKVYPPEVRNNFENTIDWLKDKACARKSGLGTPLPWDKDWIVETLSDSTIYMAFYTIAGIISKNKIKPQQLTEEVFDYVFLGKGKPEQVGNRAKIKPKVLKQMREEFKYFYPVDMRLSAKDLVQNHLIFYMFHHTALWNEDKWPKAIGVNGYVNIEGQKMSKSKGNVIPLKELVKDYGADLVRLNIAGSAEGLDDADWRTENIKSYRSRLLFLEDTIKQMKKFKKGKLGHDEKYLMSKLQGIVMNADESYENLNFRTAITKTLFDGTNLLKWYLERNGNNKDSVKEFVSTIVRLITPAAPHVCEELWSMLDGKGFAATAPFPKSNEKLIDDKIENEENYLMKVSEDIKSVVNMLSKNAGFKLSKVTLFVAEPWKIEVYNKVREGLQVKDLMKEEKFKKHGAEVVALVQKLQKRQPLDEIKMSPDEELKILKDCSSALGKSLGAKIEIIQAEKGKHAKAYSAEPGKPGILIE